MSQTYWWQTTDNEGSRNLAIRTEVSGEPAEVVHREVSFEMDAEGDGRTLYTRIVPYNKPNKVADPPFFEPYMEEWKPGVFDRQLRAANRVDVLLNFEHERGIGGVVGRGVELRSQPDGLHGTFRLLNNPDGEKTRELVHDGVLTGLSLEATILKSARSSNGLVSRMEARLRAVAICRHSLSAFPGAEVLAIRTEGEDEPAPSEPEPGEPEPSEPEPEPETASRVIPVEIVTKDDISGLLEKVGVAQTPKLEVVRGAWDGSKDRFDDEQFLGSCLIVRDGDGPAKERCSLPILEPTGELNVSALAIAARMLPTTTGITNAQRSEAARHLIRLYRLAQMEAPGQIVDAARR